MRHYSVKTLLAGILLSLTPLTAQAQDGPEVPPAQSRVFALALILRACDLRAQDYIEAILALKTNTVDDDQAKAEVSRRSREVFRVRRAQSEGYTQAARMLTRMGAPSDIHNWVSLAAARFKAPLAYDDEARKMARTDLEAGRVMAELNELQSVNASADALKPTMAIWLKLTEGTIAIWTADVGSYAADLRRAAATPAQSRLLGRAALRLLLKAPHGSPSGVRGDLSELVPAGGNLQNLSNVLPEATPREKISLVYSKIVNVYEARKTAEALDNAE